MATHSLRRQLLAQRRFRQLLLLLTIFSVVLGIAIVPFESGEGPIDSYGEGLWWAAVTVSSVGYGDYVPVTLPGRLIGVLLMAMGVLVIGLLVGMVAHTLHRRQDDMYRTREFEYLDNLTERLTRVEKKLDYLVKDGHLNDDSHTPQA